MCATLCKVVTAVGMNMTLTIIIKTSEWLPIRQHLCVCYLDTY